MKRMIFDVELYRADILRILPDNHEFIDINANTWSKECDGREVIFKTGALWAILQDRQCPSRIYIVHIDWCKEINYSHYTPKELSK